MLLIVNGGEKIKYKLIGRKILLFALFIMVLVGTMSMVSASDSIEDGSLIDSSNEDIDSLSSDSIDEDNLDDVNDDESNEMDLTPSSNVDVLSASSNDNPFNPDEPGPYNHTYDLEPFHQSVWNILYILNL